MGQVWLAQDTRLGRKVAIKTLPSEFTGSVERAHRFKQEALAVSALNHPHIITIHDIGETEDCRFIVMELVKGRTLREMIGSPFTVDELIRLGRQIAKALAAMHAAARRHRVSAADR